MRADNLWREPAEWQEGVGQMGKSKKAKKEKKAKRESGSEASVKRRSVEGLSSGGSQGGAPAAAKSKMKRKEYEREMRRLQGELVAMQEWVKATGAKVCIVFEGLDSAGKGGTIRRITERTSPRVFKHIALPAPTEREQSQMYLQRYMAHFPSAGEVAIFDRSWYNRAGVEPVMGYCTPEQTERFLSMTPAVEKAMVDSGIILIKYWLNVGVDEQTRRLENRIEDPRKIWKLSPTDLKSYSRHFDYCRARDTMLADTDTEWAPWYVADNDNKKRGRLNIISHLLSQIPYDPLAPTDVKMPRPPSTGGYVEADRPLRNVPDRF
jgi:polyphosphate kinase 2